MLAAFERSIPVFSVGRKEKKEGKKERKKEKEGEEVRITEDEDSSLDTSKLVTANIKQRCLVGELTD